MAEPNLSPAKILVIDDSVSDIALLRYALDRSGEDYELEILNDGDEALQFVHEHRSGKRDPVPCVIVLDIHLPRSRGLEVLKAIREEPALMHIKVVVLAGIASPGERTTIASMGARYIQKPIELSSYIEVGTVILELCKRARTAMA